VNALLVSAAGTVRNTFAKQIPVETVECVPNIMTVWVISASVMPATMESNASLLSARSSTTVKQLLPEQLNAYQTTDQDTHVLVTKLIHQAMESTQVETASTMLVRRALLVNRVLDVSTTGTNHIVSACVLSPGHINSLSPLTRVKVAEIMIVQEILISAEKMDTVL